MDRAIHHTTVLAVKKGDQVAIASDGQVTIGNTIMKQRANKIRTLYKGKVLVGFAGSVADALSLFEKLDGKLNEFSGNLTRAAVELAKDWRTDKILRRLEALLVAADKDDLFIISGQGDIIEPDEGIAAIGSGGPFAYAAAKALIDDEELTARQIVEKAMKIAASICIYTNENITIEEL